MYASQDATVRTGTVRTWKQQLEHGTKDWFQIGKGVRQSCVLSTCIFNLHAEYVMQNATLDEAQAGIKMAGQDGIKIADSNINNLKYADGTIL